MILFVNVFLTDQKLLRYDRGLLPQYNQVDIFKYSMSSLASIPLWTKVVIYVELNDNYKCYEKELEDFIRYEFKNVLDFSYFTFRNGIQKSWQLALNPIMESQDKFVWFTCNHDHIFMDSDVVMLQKMLDFMEEQSAIYPYVSTYLSHWPELVRAPYYWPNKIYSDYSYIEWDNLDSIQIVNKNLLKYWWYDFDYGDHFLGRTDYFGDVCKCPIVRCCIPHKEMCRHFDGYNRAGDVDINKCPPLDIPFGFFDRDIQISYCRSCKCDNMVQVDPESMLYKCVDSNGADYKFLLEDIPMFWNGRISNISKNILKDENKLYDLRNESVYWSANPFTKIDVPKSQISCAFKYSPEKHTVFL